MTPIQLYTFPTPNGHKASIMLEETGLPYEVKVIDIERGDQKTPEFLALNLNNKIPVIVDPDRDRTVVESGAILFYLAERAGRLMPRNAVEHGTTLQWILFQAAHVGPTLGQVWNWKIFDDEKPPRVVARFEREAERVFRVLDTRLGQRTYLAGNEFGIADIMTWPWINVAEPKLDLDLGVYANLRRWFDEVAARPAVQRGLLVPHLEHPAA
ncbi:glutathione S-transferase family protein [Bradyrhizobium prioriisuperbiae]|uniref:glutathione S-transferase family protein n=1 Tax=Bradyrhizobium prioriisuperbiae TaxID=2854389 RepID=UPI0028E2E5C2|nr:glutathione S-transferase N-terminal domain-containing protein [Bradyrhizobium prioritasuperba]